MARKRHTAEQIIGMLREAEVGLAEGKRVTEMVRELGVTEQTYYRWRREHGGRPARSNTARIRPPPCSADDGAPVEDPLREPAREAVPRAGEAANDRSRAAQIRTHGCGVPGPCHPAGPFMRDPRPHPASPFPVSRSSPPSPRA